MPTFADLPRGTQIRLAAVAVLKSAATFAGPRVFDSRLDPIDVADMPAIVVTSTESRGTIAGAGGPPAFRVAYTLRLQGIVIAAAEDDAVLQADNLRQQMLDGLLEDPVWPALVEAIDGAEETLWVGRTDNRFERQTILTLTTAWREQYSPRRTSPLLTTGQPAAPRQVIAPLTDIETTLAVAPGDSFSIQTSISQT